jgi:aryl-alcohol dehydrogenase-like predicted oxidoreductase
VTGPAVELALGTVQFGTTYGVAGRGAIVPANEVREILAKAWECGVRVLDTAPVYGDIEQRLGDLAGDHPFAMVSKVPALPADAASVGVAPFVIGAIGESRVRLGVRLRTILFHRGEDLLGPHGEAVWRAATDAVAGSEIRLGASFYSPETAAEAHARFALAVVQLPGNVLDQRLVLPSAISGLTGVEIHLRSVFLQGLLLLPRDRAVTRVPRAAGALEAWAKWCAGRGVAPLRAALSVARSLPGVRYCVVGVDRLGQLEEIVAAWRETETLYLPALATADEDVIDPRRWSAA